MQAWFGDCKGLGHNIAGISNTKNRRFCQNLGFEQRAKQHYIYLR